MAGVRAEGSRACRPPAARPLSSGFVSPSRAGRQAWTHRHAGEAPGTPWQQPALRSPILSPLPAGLCGLLCTQAGTHGARSWESTARPCPASEQAHRARGQSRAARPRAGGVPFPAVPALGAGAMAAWRAPDGRTAAPRTVALRAGPVSLQPRPRCDCRQQAGKDELPGLAWCRGGPRGQSPLGRSPALAILTRGSAPLAILHLHLTSKWQWNLGKCTNNSYCRGALAPLQLPEGSWGGGAEWGGAPCPGGPSAGHLPGPASSPGRERLRFAGCPGPGPSHGVGAGRMAVSARHRLGVFQGRKPLPRQGQLMAEPSMGGAQAGRIVEEPGHLGTGPGGAVKRPLQELLPRPSDESCSCFLLARPLLCLEHLGLALDGTSL